MITMKKKCKNCAYYRRSLLGIEYCVVDVQKVWLEKRRKRHEIMCDRFISLKRKERKELMKKTRSLEKEIVSRWGINYVENYQRKIRIMESLLERAKNLTPERKEKLYAILKDLKKRELEKRKTPKRVCIHCGKHIPLKANFCSRCGNKVEN